MTPLSTLAPSSNPHAGTVAPTSTTPFVAQAATAGTAGNAKSLAASLASAPVAGSLIVAFIGTGDASTVTTPPSGWSAAVDAAGHACQAMSGGADVQGEQVYVHTAAAGEGAAKYTFTFASSTASAYAIALLEVHNAGAKPIAACGSTNPAKDTATAKLASATLTATAANQLPLVGYAPSTSGLTVTRSSGWTGTLYNATQTPYLTLDVEYGPLTSAAGGTVAPATAVSNLSTPTIVYAPSVDVLIDAGTASSPAPSSAPSAAPSAVPITPATAAPGTGTATGSLQNAVGWPASFRPYAATSYWNRPMTNTTNPTLLANSDAMIGLAYANGDADGSPLRVPGNGGGYNQGHPIVFASSTDPVVNLHCTLYCGATPTFTTMHIPAQARAGDGSDHHLAVIQPDGEEVDMWAMSNPSSNWTSGSTLSSETIDDCGNFYTGSGLDPRGSAVVGGACLGGGIVTKAQLVDAGAINHALFLMEQCGANSYVYPAGQHFDTVCTGGGPNLPNGAHVWLDLSPAAISALPITAAEKVLLTALHNYGGYIMDSSGQSGSRTSGVMYLENTWDNSESFQAFGASAPLSSWAVANGWNGVTVGGSTWPTFADPWSPLSSVGGWKAHLHVVDPCYAQGSC